MDRAYFFSLSRVWTFLNVARASVVWPLSLVDAQFEAINFLFSLFRGPSIFFFWARSRPKPDPILVQVWLLVRAFNSSNCLIHLYWLLFLTSILHPTRHFCFVLLFDHPLKTSNSIWHNGAIAVALWEERDFQGPSEKFNSLTWVRTPAAAKVGRKNPSWAFYGRTRKSAFSLGKSWTNKRYLARYLNFCPSRSFINAHKVPSSSFLKIWAVKKPPGNTFWEPSFFLRKSKWSIVWGTARKRFEIEILV